MADHEDQQARTRLSDKEKLEKRVARNSITVESADKIKSAYVWRHIFTFRYQEDIVASPSRASDDPVR
jgi:hypothetical protein